MTLKAMLFYDLSFSTLVSASMHQTEPGAKLPVASSVKSERTEDILMETVNALCMTRSGFGMEDVLDVPWGTHLCQFYRSRSDLTDVLIPFLHSGLERNQLCIYVANDPLSEGEAKSLFHEVLPSCQSYLKLGQLETSDFRQWCPVDVGFNPEGVSERLLGKLEWSRLRGYDGVRIAGSVGPLETGQWEPFMKYEEAVDLTVPGQRMTMSVHISWTGTDRLRL